MARTMEGERHLLSGVTAGRDRASPQPMEKQMSPWKFNIGDKVRIADGAETGHVIGRAEYAYSENSYLVRYVGGNGCAVEAWWTSGALIKADD